MTNDKTVTMSRELVEDRARFEKWHNEFYGPQDKFNPIRSLAHDSFSVGLGYDDPTVQAQFCAFRGALAAPVVERQEPVAHRIEFNDGHKSGWYDGPPSSVDTDDVVDGVISGVQLAYAEQPAPVAVVLPEKYDDVLMPFLALMRAELHANAHKGDRPGWLMMDRKTAVLEVFYHMGKLHQAVHRDEASAIQEYAADVANMCMMLLDVCACLDKVKELNQ